MGALSAHTPRYLSILTTNRSVTRSPWRVGVPLQALARLGHHTRIVAEDRVAEHLPRADILVLHNPASAELVELVHEARQQGVAVIVDVDDLLLPGLLPTLARFGRWWHPLRFKWEAETRVKAGLAEADTIAAAPRNDAMLCLQECIRSASMLTVTTATLAQAYHELNPAIYVLPNCYDDMNPLWNVELPPRPTVNIGFLGTEHHGPNLDLLRGALEPILQRDPTVRLVEAGQGGLLTRVDAPARQLVQLGWLPFDVFPLVLHQMDIVLAPLVDEPFMRCKSNIRCMTAGLVGAPVVASPVGPYAEYVEHGVNGFLATEQAEWADYVERLVVDPALRRSMGEANRLRARPYALSLNIERWSDVYYAALHDRRCCA
jgi:glycosyltransferase involved in cell wall biosynthesis